MELYLLRHGASTANERRLVCGAEDFPLSQTGLAQAARVCRHLEQIPFTRIFTSSLSRARNTVAPLVKEADRIRVEQELVELNTGSYSHLTLDVLWERDPRYQRPWLQPDLRYPGGECFSEMVSRITGWYDRESRNWEPDETVLIVGHEGTLRSILLRLLGGELSAYPDFPIGNCDLLHATIVPGHTVTYRHIPLTSLAD
ncbi:histidine phosphatase family protein [Paraburkholderia sp. J12]|uniref:histidine phosphatase family protein n=1 Tax=Paraburkholderia sp. J12 TaxID=2805432 RepID=UPI002ABE4664|nr:histidine phosphatase family protein [Paraburkholderia sp. J12]